MPGVRKRRSRQVNKSTETVSPRASWFAWTLATWFGSGRSPWAPGTAGTAATLPLVYLFARYGPVWGSWNPACLLAAILLFYPAVVVATAVETELGHHDPGLVVVDETIGTLLTFAFLPATALHSPYSYVAVFFLFRLLDVWKPGFIGQSQALPRGWGIVIDDVLAGLVGGVLLGILWHFI